MANVLLRKKKKIEKKGRKGDKFIAHLTPGEIVIPRPFAEHDGFRAILAASFKENGIDLEEFIVGSGKNKINPKTGYLEFGVFSKFNPFKRHSYFRGWFDPAMKAVLAIPKATMKAAFPKPPGITPPALPPSPVSAMQISEQAAGAGAAEGRRLRRRRGRLSTRLTTPGGALTPPSVARPGLKTTLG